MISRTADLNENHADLELTLDLFRRAIPEISSGTWQLLGVRAPEFRKHYRKRIVLATVAYRKGFAGRIDTVDLVAKCYGTDRGGNALTGLSRLWNAGFAPPARDRVPRLYGYSPAHGVLVQGRAPGISWADSVWNSTPMVYTASCRAAAWLLRLQASTVMGRVIAWDRDVASARRFASELVGLMPSLDGRLEDACERLVTRLREPGCGSLIASHGDYHPKNVFISAGLTTVIDFDTFGLRESGALEARRVGVYYHDSAHGEEERTLRLIEPYLADRALLIVDDSDWEKVAASVESYLAGQPRARLLIEIGGADKGLPQWWEGVAVLAWES